MHSPGRTGREENYLSKPLDRSFSLSHPSLSLSRRTGILPPPLLTSLSVPHSSSRSSSPSLCLALSIYSSSSLSPRAPRSFSTVVRVPSFSRVYVGKALDISGRRLRETQFLGACTTALPWTTAAVATAAAEATATQRWRTKPSVTSPSVYTKNAREETESSGIISGGDAGANGERASFARHDPVCASGDQRARSSGRE